MEIMYNFDELVSRETKESIQKQSKFSLKFKKTSVPSKGIILNKIDDYDNFLKAHGFGKHSETRSFRQSKYQLTQL